MRILAIVTLIACLVFAFTSCTALSKPTGKTTTVQTVNGVPTVVTQEAAPTMESAFVEMVKHPLQ